MKFLYQVILIIGLLGCSVPNNSNSKGFNDLLDKFGSSIPVERHLYFLIPQVSCRGCVTQALQYVQKYVQIKDTSYLTFISGIPEIDLQNFKTRSKVYVDTNNYLNELPFSVANFTIIETKNSSILNIISLNPNNVDMYINKSIFESCRKP